MFILGINPLKQQYFHKMNLAVSFLNIILSFTVHGSLKCKIINIFLFQAPSTDRSLPYTLSWTDVFHPATADRTVFHSVLDMTVFQTTTTMAAFNLA